MLVFQTNGKQPYSFPVLSRCCNGLCRSPNKSTEWRPTPPIVWLANRNFAAASDRRIEPIGVLIAGALSPPPSLSFPLISLTPPSSPGTQELKKHKQTNHYIWCGSQ